MLEIGNKVLIAHRRLYEKDESRYFVGEVLDYSDGVVKVKGYTFVRDLISGNFLRKRDPRTKIASILSGTMIFYMLPSETEIDSVHFEFNDSELDLVDAKGLKMNMTEQPHRGVI